MTELLRTRCKQGELIITDDQIIIELRAFGTELHSRSLLRSSFTSLDSKLAMISIMGMGSGVNLTFHGKGGEVLQADLFRPKDAKAVVSLLTR